MKIVQEKVDEENYLEICLAPHDWEKIKEYTIVSQLCYVKDERIIVGIKLDLEMEETEI